MKAGLFEGVAASLGLADMSPAAGFASIAGASALLGYINKLLQKKSHHTMWVVSDL
jgi:hypothetical protein